MNLELHNYLAATLSLNYVSSSKPDFYIDSIM